VTRALATLAIVAALAAPAAASAAPAAGDAEAVKAVILRETALTNSASWSALWNTYEPAFHRMCNHARWLAAAKVVHKAYPQLNTIAIQVRVSGSRAVANYVLRYRKIVLAWPQGDVYVKSAASGSTPRRAAATDRRAGRPADLRPATPRILRPRP
jgi:hypothetical protein